MKAIENAIVSVDALYFSVVALARAEQDVRYYLNGVAVQPAPNGEGAVIVATNGHYLMAMHDMNGICEKDVILNVDKRLLQDCGKGGGRKLVVDKEGVTRVHDGVTGIVSYQLPDKAFIDGVFPQWRKIIPAQNLVPGLPNACNASYINLFLTAVSKINKRNPASFFHDPEMIEDGISNSSVVVVRSGNDFIGLIMPMREKLSCVVPGWAAPEKAEEEKPKKAKVKKAA